MKKYSAKFISMLLSVILLTGCMTGCNPGEQEKDPETTLAPYTGEEEEEDIEMLEAYTGANAETIYAARDLANDVNAYYSDGDRTGYTIVNQNVKLNYNLSGDGSGRLVKSLQNTKGQSYFENSADAYVVTTDGEIYYASGSVAEPSVNIYRHGYYYYDIHILGQDLANESTSGESAELDFLNYNNANMLKNVKKNSDGTLSMEVENSSDPYINWTKLSYSADEYGFLSVTLKTNVANSGDIFIVAGDYSDFNGTQCKSFTITADGEYHTYIINLKDITGYTGTLKGIRLDYNNAAADVITIKEMKLVKSSESTPNIQIDRQYHTFSDKMNSVVRFLAVEKCTNIAEFVTETKISAETVDKIVVKDASGDKNTLDGIDWDTAEYIGFDIKDTGIFGYILIDDDTCGKIRVTLEDGYYIIRQSYEPANNTLKRSKDVCLGQRYYTDESHDFTAFLNEAYCERHPLTELSADCKKSVGKFRGYNALRGVYEFFVQLPDGFSAHYYDIPDKQYELPVELKGDDRDRKIYIYTVCEDRGTLECAAVLDENSQLLPIKVEVCKNFRGDGDETIFEQGDASYGNTFFPVVVKANETSTFKIMHLYMNWGKVPLKQLSSIMFYAPYYHLSTGVTETNCIAPYYVHGKDLWTIPDFRSMSAPLWSDQPQHTSGGCPYIIQYKDTTGNHTTDLVTTKIDSSGQTYADVKMNYISDDGKLSATYRHLEMPQTDENRAYYEVTINIRDTIEIENFAEDFSFVSMDGRCLFYERIGYLDENNNPTVVKSNNDETPRNTVLGTECPYFDMFYALAEDYVNMSVIVQGSDITIGGKKFTGNFLISESKVSNLNKVRLSLNLGKVTLKAGDTMKLVLIIMPFGSQESTDDSNVLRVRENTCLNPITISTEDGEVIEDALMPKVASKDHKSVTFTVSGGKDNLAGVNENYYNSCDYNIAVRAYKFTALGVPKIYELVNGEWQVFEIASENGYDGYTVFVDADNSFSYSFVFNMNEGKDRTFKIVVE